MSPNKKLIPPGKFIDIAEETSLINDIGDIVLEKVCRDIKSWNTQGLTIRIAVNISAVQLAIKYFAESVLEKIHSYGLDPKEFELELTENVLIQNMKRTISNIVKLTDAGIRIAIDDFGTGYSSLGYLDRLPLNTLKLDRSFMQKVSAENMNNTIIPAIINVSNGLQLDFIAEGIETQAQHKYLQQQGSCIAQGFYYSRPLEKERLIAFIDKHGVKKQS
jgi:EAL domain-containing protein (putative c-di-GMP-specific phosphodiesterase class I)